MDFLGQFRAADSLFHLLSGDMERVTSYPFQPTGRTKIKRSLPLPASLPESEGVPSRCLYDFFHRLEKDPTLCTHGVCILRHGKRIAEAAWQPYSKRLPQMQFSLSKSVVGMAVGMAQAEGILSLNEKVKDIFPDRLPPLYLGKPGEVTVHQLLTMSSGVRFNELGSASEKDWVRAWLLSDCEFAPGSRFSYNSMNTYILSAILCRKTGQSLTDYLTPRLWEPLGIGVPFWETCPMGVEKGGWGLYLTPGDMAKLGQLYLQKGQWRTSSGWRSILPEEWVQQAMSPQIPCRMGERDAWYGYQLWGLSWGEGCQFNGVFGQYVVILPKEDMVIAVTSGNGQLFEDRTLLHIRECFCTRALSPSSLPPDPEGIRALSGLLSSLHVISELKPPILPKTRPTLFQRLRRPKPAPAPSLPQAARYNGRTYSFPENHSLLLPLVIGVVHGNFPKGIRQMRFRLGMDRARFWFYTGDICHTIEAGYNGNMLPCVLNFNEEPYPCRAGVRFVLDEDDRMVLKLFLVFPETPCIRTMKLVFYGEDGDHVLLRMDERPYAARAAEMFLGLITGGKKADEWLPAGAQKLPVFSRIKELLCPKLNGVWEKE